jgi:multiple sugar transport system permease protein
MKLSRTHKKTLKLISQHAMLISFSLVMLAPFLWMVVTSFKSVSETISFPPHWIPKKPTLAAYYHAWKDMKFGIYFGNSLYVTVVTTVLATVIGGLTGYGFARYKIRGHRIWLIGIFFSKMFPPILFAVPMFIFMMFIGLLDSLEGLILAYTTFALPFTVWMLRGYFQTIPMELEEAATIDGCSKFSAFFRVILPLSAPGLAATSVFCFVLAWNEFMFANFLIQDESKRVLTVALNASINEYAIHWNDLMAASILTTMPIIIFFIFAQKYLVNGITAGGVKG